MSITHFPYLGDWDTTDYDQAKATLQTIPCPTWCITQGDHIQGPSYGSDEAERTHHAYKWTADNGTEVSLQALESISPGTELDRTGLQLFIETPSDITDPDEAAELAEHVAAAVSAWRAALA